ncbi:sensor histidine kinase [Roseibium litorale]|uniref:histidine kinase n=1 Tax=Roseibium litorale TaxID=2803841 RepID=A0ABR9CUU8_9HYPH|nr:PAS-domain containing protein [Roseibium litorale]MBD8893996.1 PAS-domain containing protein [Roseibium litorale]
MLLFRRNCDPLEVIELIAGSIHHGISLADRDLNLVMINRTAQRLLDLPDSLLNETVSLEDLFRFNANRGDYGPGDPEAQVQERIKALRRGVAQDFVRERPGGQLLRVQRTPVDQGGFVTVYTDVTYERMQEKKLQEAHRQLESALSEKTSEFEAKRDLLFNAFNVISDGLGLASPDGQIILANDRMRQIFPEVDRLIGEKATVHELIRTVFPDEPKRDVGGMLSDEEMWTERCFPDGKWYKVSRSRSNDGGMISVYTDVTSYKEQQAVLQKHTDELVRLLTQEKELTEMQREFVSMASHEFRTPLAIIDSNAQRLKRKADGIEPEALMERIDRIRDAVDRMQYLINRFLNFSQAQSIGVEVQVEPVSFCELVMDVCERQQSVSRKHTIHLDLEGLPEVVEIDRRLVEQSISNILSNAVKYSPGRPDIYVRGGRSGDYAVLSVRDEGVGIPKEEIPKIFNRYYRASTSSGIAGTGIGLNMADLIVRKHHGRVEITSEVGAGTNVTLFIPVRGRKIKRPTRREDVQSMREAG